MAYLFEIVLLILLTIVSLEDCIDLWHKMPATEPGQVNISPLFRFSALVFWPFMYEKDIKKSIQKSRVYNISSKNKLIIAHLARSGADRLSDGT